MFLVVVGARGRWPSFVPQLRDYEGRPKRAGRPRRVGRPERDRKKLGGA